MKEPDVAGRGDAGCAGRGRATIRPVLLLLVLLSVAGLAQGAPLSDPEVDAYNVRVGTQTFSGLYQFTDENLLVETARAITNMGSDTIKMYMGWNFSGKYHTNLTDITSLLQLARDEPNCRYVLNMPFRRIITWVYPLSNPDAPFGNGNYTPTEQANDYREIYDLTCYLLTNYNNSGKTFYLGHWEGDGYLNVVVNGKSWATNPSPAVVSSMIAWENNRQKAVDDAKAATVGISNVNVFYYLEVNRVRDAMVNGSTNNVRVVNAVLPYVTNIDFVSYSSYDAQNLSTADLYATLRCIETNTPPPWSFKAAALPPSRLWIGEYGWGATSPAQQEPAMRSYWQRLLNYSNTLPFILYWEIYDNETNADGSYRYFYLIDPNNNKTPCWYLHNSFINGSRLFVGQFKETNQRLPTDSEFSAWASPRLNQPLSAPINLSVSNASAVVLSNSSAQVAGLLTQGVYGEEQATVRVFWGRTDGGTTRSAWEQGLTVGVNTNFNPATFTAVLSNLANNASYCYRFYATNAGGEAWAPASGRFDMPALDPADFGSRMKITFAGYTRGETLSNFPALVCLSTNLPGFSYRQFASASGGDLRFTDAGGTWLLPSEVETWNTNGISTVWVRVPELSGPDDYIWAYWGNPAGTNPPASSGDGSVWSPGFELVWHLKEATYPYADSTLKHPAVSGNAPAPATGCVGQGGAFNGSSQYLNAQTIDLGDAFTLSACVKLDNTATNIQTIWANKPGGWNSDGFALFVDSYNTADQQLRLETGNGTAGMTAATPSGAVSFGQWHRLTAVVDRAAGTGRLYVDGVDRTQSSGILTSFNNQNVVNLARLVNNNSYFKGTLDEVRIELGTRSSTWVWAGWMTVASNATFAACSPVTQVPPSLSLSWSGDGFLLGWPGSGVGFGLYTATNLLPPVTWSLATNQPSLVGREWQVALPVEGDCSRFFRLQALN